MSIAGTALAWEEPTLTALCAPDQNSYAWRINLHKEKDFNIDWSFDSFATFTTTDFLTKGDHEFTTPRGGPTLMVRWSSEPDVSAQADANPELCEPPEQTVEAATGTPASTVTNASIVGGQSGPLPTILFSLVLLASLSTLAYANVKAVARRNH